MNSSKNLKIKSPIKKPRKSLTRRKSLKLLKDAKNILQKTINDARNIYVGDRIMAHRSYMNFNESEDILLSRANRRSTDLLDDLSVPSFIENTVTKGRGRLIKLTAKHKSPSCEEKIKMLYAKNESISNKYNRHISMHPERILDAPMLSSECWNILDWNCKGVLAVALGAALYLWDSVSGTVNELVENENEISALKWLSGDMINVIAFGDTKGNLSLWKDEKFYKNIVIRSNVKVTAIAYTKGVLSVGLDSGLIKHLNLKTDSSSSNTYHRETIHQMKWSSNHAYLAVSSKDGSISVWTAKDLICNPIAHFKENNVGMEDMAWSPNNEEILFYAGGVNNTILKIMNVNTKQCIKSLKGNCKMSRVFWSASFNEIAVTAQIDYSQCTIKLFKDSSLKMITEMSGHKGEIMAMVSNSVTGVLTTIGRDESIRLWTCFKEDGIIKSKPRSKMTIMNGFHHFR